MNASPGWYQDVHQPPGHLRYWDGHRWTEHRTYASPVARPTAPARAPWFRRHTAWTAVLVVVLLVLGGSLLPDEDATDPTSASAQDDEVELPEPEPSEQPAEPASDDREEPAEAVKEDEAADDAERAASAARPKPNRRTTPTFLVTRVIDGDTVELANGENVRLVGIDTPEVGECGFEGASAELSRLVLGKRVELVRSDEDRDGYGRLLRYVDVAGTDAGLRLIRNGRAIAAYDSRDGYGFHPREPRYVASDRGAKNLCPMATGTNPQPRPVSKPAPEPAPKPRPLIGAGGGCPTGYTPCLPAGPDLDCPDVNGPIRVTGSDPHGLDADGDGWACES
jgi:endonuclease YncB( thermonuclease family)